MAADRAKVDRLLGKKAAAVVQSVEDRQLRKSVIDAFGICVDALDVLDRLNLTRYELDTKMNALAVWNGVSPRVRELKLTVGKTCARLLEAFPPPEFPPSEDLDVDRAFDALTGSERPADAVHSTPPEQREEMIDEIARASVPPAAESIAPSVARLVAMLKNDFSEFNTALESNRGISDRWFLLGTLSEFRVRCIQCIEAILAAVVGAFSNEPMESLFPRYQSPAQRAVKIRASITELHHAVNELRAQISEDDNRAALTSWRGILEQVGSFTGTEAYELIRPSDKKQIVEFRDALDNWYTVMGPIPVLQEQIEGFSKFLEVVRGNLGRGRLKDQDRETLFAARRALEDGSDVESVLQTLRPTYGRADRLDDYLRAARRRNLPDKQQLLESIGQVLESSDFH